MAFLVPFQRWDNLVSSRRSVRRQKLPVLLFCEGESELGYGKFLNIVAARSDRPLHFISENLRGGNSETLVLRALKKIENTPRYRNISHRALILDSDRPSENSGSHQSAITIANNNRIILLWQRPCHEAFLVRHFARYQSHEPPTAEIAFQLLKSEWPNYRKGLQGSEYAACLSEKNIQISRETFTEYDEFLKSIRWFT